ncbi:MAG: hypothetical protein QXJ06_01085 [Candidatus Aenigmatarchaeota archaeon]
MPRKRIDQFLARKVVLLILLGAMTALLAASIASKAEVSAQITLEDAIVMILISLVLFFITGVLWLYTAILIKDLEEC